MTSSRPNQPIEECEPPPLYTLRDRSSASSTSDVPTLRQYPYQTLSPGHGQPITYQSLNRGLTPIQEAGEEASQKYLDMAENLFRAAQTPPQAAELGILRPQPSAHTVVEPISQPANITAATAVVGSAVDTAVAATAAVGAASMAIDAISVSFQKTTAVASKKKPLPTDNKDVTTCPICSATLKGVNMELSERHVKDCLDGNYVPLLETAGAATNKDPAETTRKNRMSVQQPVNHVTPTTSKDPKALRGKSAMSQQKSSDHVAPTTHPSSTCRSVAINPYSLPPDFGNTSRSEDGRLASALGRLGLERSSSNSANRSFPTAAQVPRVPPVPRALSVPKSANNSASPTSAPNAINADPFTNTYRTT